MWLVILRGGTYLGLSGWDLYAITNVLIRKRHREKTDGRGERREAHREGNGKTGQRERQPLSRNANIHQKQGGAGKDVSLKYAEGAYLPSP